MPSPLTADDLLPLVAQLAPRERLRFLRLIAASPGRDADAYRAAPPTRDEFLSDEDTLAWEAEGWEDVE